MASSRTVDECPLDDGHIPLDIENTHMDLQVEQEQIQKRTFTNWINAQLSKRFPPTAVSDLFSDLKDGARLLDLLEVMSGQCMKREKGRSLFQKRCNIETALNFLRNKSIKLVNINISDIVDGRPSIILGLIWTIILHCRIEVLTSNLSFRSHHSSIDTLSNSSPSSSPALGRVAPDSPTSRGGASRLHSAKKALLLWVKDQCQRAGCSVSVKDFKSSWRSGEAFLAILCSLRPDLVDLSLAQTRGNKQNLEEAFRLAEKELHIPRLLEPQDVDVKRPDEKSIMTYVAQFLQYSNDRRSPDNHLQDVSSESSPEPVSPQVVLALTQEATWLLREPLQVSSVPLNMCRERIQLLNKKMMEVDLSCLLSSPEFKACDIERLQQTVPEICHKLTEVEKTCRELQQASSMLEGHLAELSHWGTEALESYQNIKKRKHMGHSGPQTSIKMLISRGLQLEGQVVAEGQDLQALVDNAQNCPLLSLSTSTIQDRVSNTVSHSQEIMELLSSRAFSQRVCEAPGNQLPTKIMCQTEADTKVQTNGTIDHQTQDPSQPQSSFPKQGKLNYSHSQDKNIHKTMIKVLPHAEIQIEPQHLAKMTKPQIPSPLDQIRKEAESKCLSQSQSSARTHVQVPNPSQTEQHPYTGSEPLDKAESPKSVRDKKEPSSHSQMHSQKLRLRRQQNLLQTECGNQKPPLPPALVRSDVHSKAQAVAKNRLEKAKYRVQEHIQEAIILFSDKEISEWQAKRKQRALRTLKKAVLEEFLGAVEGFSSFCSETQLQDLMLLSVSVRKQWEDVCSEMANFLPLLWSQIRRRGKTPLSHKECEMHANSLHDTADQIDFEYVQKHQACLSTDGGLSLGSILESHQETCPAVAQPRESSGRQETTAQTLQSNETSNSVLPQQDRGQQNTPLSRSGTQADPQPTDDNHPSLACPDQDPTPSINTELPQASDCTLHVKTPTHQIKDCPPLDEDHQKLTLGQEPLPSKDLDDDEQEPLLQTQDQHRLKVHSGVLHIPQSQAQLQAVVRGDVVETRQAAERTVIPPEVPPQQEEGLLQQEVLKRYQDSSLAFHSQLQRNRQLLQTAESVPDPVGVSTLQNQLQNLQTLKQETEALWFEFELQYAQLSQLAYLQEEEGRVERDRAQLLQQWRSQQISLQNRMASYDTTIDLMEASDCQMKLITEQLDHITRQAVDISSLSLADSKAVNDLKEMDLRLEAEMSKLSGKAAEEEKEGLDGTIPSLLGHASHSRFHHLRQLREHLKKVESALHALDCFLVSLRQGQAEIHALMESSSRQGDEVVQVSHSWQAVARQRFQMAGEDAARVDGLLKATGMTLTMDGTTVTCEDVGVSLVQRLDEVNKELSRSREDQNKELCVLGRSQEMRVGSKVKSKGSDETGLIKTEGNKGCSGRGQTQEETPPSPSGMELGSGLEPERCKSGEQDEESKELRGEEVPSQEAEHTGGRRRAQDQSSGSKDQRRRRRRSSQGKKEGEETKSAVQRRFTFLRLLREIQGATGELGLKEPTLHAVQQRMRALTELESRLAGQRSELLYLLDASSQSAATADVTHMNEMEALFEETQTGVIERLDQCRVLAELLKRFQVVGSELSSTLQRAEKTISEQASYMGKDNLQRLHDKVQDTKAELNVLGGRIEDVRNICRQLQFHLKQIPECTIVTFEGEADTFMDRWLDVTERTDSHLDNLHRGLALWEGLLQLGRDVESWAANKMEVFAQTPPFQTDEEVITFQNEILAQEESVERFHRRAAEIQSLLLSTEPPLELQVVESQMKKWMEEVKELFSEAEDVYRQLAAAKGQVLTRMAECLLTLQQMQDSLANLSASDVRTVRSEIQDLCTQMERQEVEAEGLLEDLSLMARLAGPESLQHLAEEGIRLRERVSVTRQLLSQTEKQIDRDMEALNSALQAEPELASSYLSQRREAHNKMETLQQQTAQLPTLFPWPGDGERRQASCQAQDLLEVAKSLGLSLTTLAEQGKELAQRTNDPIWEDSSWAALKACQSTLETQLNGVCLRLEQGMYEEERCGRLLQDCYSVVTSLQERMSTLDTKQRGSAGDDFILEPLEALLEEMGNTEKDFLHLVSLKDSLLASSTAETKAAVSKQISTLQTQKGVLENSIKEKLAWVKENMAIGDKRFRDNTFCLQEELKDLADSLAKLSENDDMNGDINRLKQQWDMMKDYDSNLKELAAKLSHLQNPGGSKVSEEILPADVTLTADALAKEHDGIRSCILQKKQETAEHIGNGVREAISQLEQWNQMVKSSTSKPTQADLDKGLQLQQAVQWVISQREFLVNCLGKKRTKKMQKSASDALCKSADVTSRVVNQEADSDVEPVLNVQHVCVPVSADVDADVELTDISEFESNTQEPETRTKLSAHSYEGDKCSDDSKASSKELFTIVLDVPQCQPQDVKHGESCEERFEKESTHSLSNKSMGRTLATTTDGESNKAVQKNLESNIPESKEPRLMEIKFTGSQIHKSTEVKSHFCKSPDSAGSDELMNHKSDGRLTASELTDTDTAGSVHAVTCPGITSEAMTDFCHIKDKQAESSVMCTVDGPGQTMLRGDALMQTQLPSTHSTSVAAAQQDMATDALQTESMHIVDTGMEDKAYADNNADTECIDTADNHTPGGIQDNLKFQEAGEESELHAALEVASTEGTQGENREGMEAEGRAAGSVSDFGAGARAGGSTESSKQQSSIMLGILSEIQGLVEKSDITNRAEYMDRSWFLECSPREAEIQLERAVMRVMRCRYQPAQLSVAAMNTQVEEAEEHKRCVLDQVAAMKLMSTRVHDPVVLRNMEGQWSAALLDASATVQVKAAQQVQVTHYHKQMKAIRVLLEVLASEIEKLNLDALGSSALQAGRLHVLLFTMEQKKGLMAELLRSCSQLSAHLTDAESSGALLAQLGDVQEEWRLLEGNAKRAVRHATVAASQSSLLLKEAEDLETRLNVIPSLLQSTKIPNQIKITTDLKQHQHRYLQLQSQLNALEHFSLGRKEKEVIERVLQGMRPLLEFIMNQLDTYLQLTIVIPSLANITKQLNELVMWAKQAENHITFGKTLALFPEEACIQIAEMRKFQSDILSRRSKMQSEVEEIKAMTSDMDQEESHQVCISLKMVEELYATIAQSSVHALEVMEKDLEQREKLLSQLAGTEAWLAEAHVKRDPCVHIEKASKADLKELESRLGMHKLATEETECQLNLVEALAEISKEIAITLNPAESHYLINRLSGLWTELDGLAAHERATSWELEELIHERTSSDEELATVQTSLKQISTDLDHQTFPLTKDTLSSTMLLKHMLMEHQCQVQALQHCEEAKRSSLLCTIEDLQERCKALYSQTLEQDKYLHLQKQMETSRDIAQKRLQRAKDKTVSLGERFRLCQTLLVELPLVKTQCQEAADQLEAIAPDMHPSQLHSERHRIRSNVETLVSWEQAITADIKNLESKLIQGLHFHSELRALMDIFQRTRQELEAAETVCPDEKAIDIALRRCWVIWRNLESGMRVLEALGRKEKIQLRKNVELYNLRDATMQASHSRMESLSQAREALQDYLWAAQGSIAFLHNAEATFLSARGGFSDCSEEQRQTQEALASLEDSLGAHIRHLVELVPLQCCLSHPQTEQLHIGILSQLLVGRATLEAQAQLRLEALQRCAARNCSHRKSHEDMRQLISRCEANLSECGTEHVTSYHECVEQQNRATSLMTELRGLTQMLEKLGAGCPVQGCGVGKDGELGALWRRWASLRRGIGLLLAHSVQRGEEWKDIATSMEQCCSSLASLQADLPDSSAATSATQGKPHELLAHARMLEQEQQALASLEHRLEHVLSLTSPPDVASLGPVAEKLEEIQENFRSLKERNVQVMTAAHTAETERQRVQEEIEEVEKRVADMLSSVEQPCLNLCQQQEVRKGLSSNKAELQRIMVSVQSRYAEVPADISCRIQEVQLSLQRAEEKFLEGSGPLCKLTNRVVEVHSGLEGVKALLEQRNATLTEAQHTLKCVWDELDTWHSRLSVLESEAQDLAEDEPEQAHLVMDQLTQPLQLYQDTANMVEQRTAFLSKIPAYLQGFEDMLHSAICWIEEAQSWVGAPCTYSSANSLQRHAHSLQLVLEDAERIRAALEDFRPLLREISAVCDTSNQEERLAEADHQVDNMQYNITEPLEQLLHAAAEVNAMETELKAMEKNVSKIQTIFSSMDSSDLPPEEHLRNLQVILANLQSMHRTLEEMERCRRELGLPQGAETSLAVFPRAKLLLQPLQELEQLAQQHAALLEVNVRQENEEMCSEDVMFTAAVVSNMSGDTDKLQRPPHGSSSQGGFEVCDSEEEDEQKDEDSAHSLSSEDTLTCSIPEDPEDPEDTLRDPDESEETHSDAQCHGESESMSELQPLSEAKTVASEEVSVGRNKPLTVSTAPLQDLAEAQCRLNEQSEHKHLTARHGGSGEEQQAQDTTETQIRWSQLHSHFSQKLATLRKVQEEHEAMFISTGEVSEKEMEMTGSGAAVLHEAQDSTASLQQLMHSMATEVSCADSSHPPVEKEVYLALRRVLLCLDRITDFLLAPVGTAPDDYQLRSLQQECLWTELETLCETLGRVEAEIRPTLLAEEPDSLRCLTCLQQCLHTAQTVLSSSQKHLHTHLSLTQRYQAGLEHVKSQVCVFEHMDLGQTDLMKDIKESPNVEYVLSSRVRESPKETAQLQQSSRALLQGLASLLDLGEESLSTYTAKQARVLPSPSQVQPFLCRHQKLFQVLGSQAAFLRHLFQHQPVALESLAGDHIQLELRINALHQEILQDEVASQTRVQEWSQWERDCGQLGQLLDQLETLVSGREHEGDDHDDVCPQEQIKERLDTCQRVLDQLEQSRDVLGLLLDQGNILQRDAGCSTSASQAGGALELRWRSLHRRTEHKIRRCQDIQDRWSRYQRDSERLDKWLSEAHTQLETLSGVVDGTTQNQEHITSCVIQLLDFSMEVQARSAQKTSVARAGTRLNKANCSEMSNQLALIELRWSKLISGRSKALDKQLQLLLARWPPVGLLSELESWLNKLNTMLNQEREAVLQARDADQLFQTLLHCQEMKTGIVNGQLVLDFLCQCGSQMAVGHIHSERTLYAERLGDLHLCWQQLQAELDCQIREIEQMHHTCTDRERRLARLCGRVTRETERLNKCRHPVSQTLAQKALLEWEANEERAKEVAMALQELQATRAYIVQEEGREEGEHPSDAAFMKQMESVSQACSALQQEMEVLRPALQHTLEAWSGFDHELSEVLRHITRVRCTLQHQCTSLFSHKQAVAYVEQLQQVQEKASEGEELCAAVDQSYQRLRNTVDPGTAQLLNKRMEGEKTRWTSVVQEVNQELLRAQEVLSLWNGYIQLSDHCSLRLQQLRSQWEVLARSQRTPPPHDMQSELDAVEKLQDGIEDLQSSVGNMFATSKLLIGHLEPLPANVIQSKTRLLSRDILLLGQTLSGTKAHLQEDLAQHKTFCTSLEALEKQAQNILHRLPTNLSEITSVKKLVSELNDVFPSLVDLSVMSCCVRPTDHEADRLQALKRDWLQGLLHASHVNRELQMKIQHSQSVQEKSESLKALQDKLEVDLVDRRCESHSSLKEMLTLHQRYQSDIMAGYQLLQAHLFEAVCSLDDLTEEKRSERMADVARVKESWQSCVSRVEQHKALVQEQFSQWSYYNHALKRLQRMLSNIDPLLPPAGPAVYTLQQLRNSVDSYQRVEETLGLHATAYNQTLEAGERLRASMTEPQTQNQLEEELQALQDKWENACTLLERRRDLVNTVIQNWVKCQGGLALRTQQLNDLKSCMKTPQPGRRNDRRQDEEELLQEKELSLEHLASGLRELATMRMDMSQYVAAGDTALLEQQLEQLHCQWEELCMKVSVRRQEIADRLNAWTIFNDKNRELCDWLMQIERKVSHSGDLSIEEMVEKLKKDCMEEINLFSENKSHLKQLGEQLLLASDETKQRQVHGTLQEVNQRWNNLFQHIEARVRKLKDTLVTVQQLDKNMSNLRCWLSRVEAELSRPITYSVCHHGEIQRRLAEQQELQRDIEQHTEGVASVLSLCDVLLRDEDAACGTETESDSLQETSRSLDQRWRTICTMALDRRLRIEETWRMWCKFLDDYSRFEDWLKMAERTAANPNSTDVLYTVAKEELKKFEGFQRQVHERLTQLELVNTQYRRLTMENRTDRASQLKAMVHQGNRRWDTLHRRVAAVLRRLKHFTSQREDFEGTRESMLVWLTELDLKLTNVEHFSESDVHCKIQQLNGFQKEIALNTERIDGLIVFGEGLIQRSCPLDAALIEEELEELHSYCQEVFGRLVRFHQRLSQPALVKEESELFGNSTSLEGSLELISRPWLGRGHGSLPATPIHLLTSPLERSGTPASVESLPLEWDHTGDVGGSSSHEDDEDDQDEDGSYFSALSEGEGSESQEEEFVEATEGPALGASSLVPSMSIPESPKWQLPGDSVSETGPQLDSEGHEEPTHTSTPLKQGYLRMMSECSGSIENIKRVSLILDDEEQPEEPGLTGLNTTDQQSGVIERWELLQAQSRGHMLHHGLQEPQQVNSDLADITSWLGGVIPELERLQHCDPAASIQDMEARVKQMKETQKTFARYKSTMLSVNLAARELQGQSSLEDQERKESLGSMNQAWSQACTCLEEWENGLRRTLMRCQEFHETLHSLLLWLAHAESRRDALALQHPDTPASTLHHKRNTLTALQEELQSRQAELDSLQALWSELQPEEGMEDIGEAREKLHVTGNKLRLLRRQVAQDLGALPQCPDYETSSPSAPEGDNQAQGPSAAPSQQDAHSTKGHNSQRERTRRDPSPPRSFFQRVLRAAFPLHLILLLLLLLVCLVPLPDSEPGCTLANNFKRSFYPMLRYTNGPPPT